VLGVPEHSLACPLMLVVVVVGQAVTLVLVVLVPPVSSKLVL
jgi:hypothetical protein